MKIIEISPENESHYFCCLEEWSEDMKEAGTCKQDWYKQMKEKGLRVKFALDDNDVIGGMIQYVPIEHSMLDGENLYVVLCIWVHGHKQGRGDYRKRGMGKALLQAAEKDSLKLGAQGLVTWGLVIPVFMRASWFKRQGYKVVDKTGLMRLLWKPFNSTVNPPKFKKLKKQPPRGEGKVHVMMFRNGWCQAMNISCERVRRASEEFPGKINLVELDTKDKKNLEEWGIFEAIYLDGKEVRIGPPPTFKSIRKKIDRKVKKVEKKYSFKPFSEN